MEGAMLAIICIGREGERFAGKEEVGREGERFAGKEEVGREEGRLVGKERGWRERVKIVRQQLLKCYKPCDLGTLKF